MTAFIAILVIVVIPVALAERSRRQRPGKAWTGYSPAVLYTRGGEPRWGVVGTWQLKPAMRRMKRRLRALERASRTR